MVEASGHEVTQADFPIQRESFTINLKIKFVKTRDEAQPNYLIVNTNSNNEQMDKW